MSPRVVSSMMAPRRARKGCLTSSANRSPWQSRNSPAMMSSGWSRPKVFANLARTGQQCAWRAFTGRPRETNSEMLTKVPSALQAKNSATISISVGGYVMMLFVT